MLAPNQTGQQVNNSSQLPTSTHDAGKLNNLLESIRELKSTIDGGADTAIVMDHLCDVIKAVTHKQRDDIDSLVKQTADKSCKRLIEDLIPYTFQIDTVASVIGEKIGALTGIDDIYYHYEKLMNG
ncbi:MAG: hypothetical protein FWD56_00405 [Bacteroidales bacterium]|nr:hypothetical protein [Bacteroidales bacterium]